MTAEQETPHSHPAPERICELAVRLTGEQEASPSDWVTRNFKDHRLSVTTNPNRRPNITVDILPEREDPVRVFEAQQNEPGYPMRYNPGRWTGYLHQIVQQTTAPNDERFTPVDDSQLFPE